jgi:hypothetical protein
VLTLTDALVSIPKDSVAPSRVFEFTSDLDAIPDYASAVDHLVTAAVAAFEGHESLVLSEAAQVGTALGNLATNSAEVGNLIEAFAKLGIKLTVNKLVRRLIGAPVALVELISDLIALNVAQGGTGAPILIRVNGF